MLSVVRSQAQRSTCSRSTVFSLIASCSEAMGRAGGRTPKFPTLPRGLRLVTPALVCQATTGGLKRAWTTTHCLIFLEQRLKAVLYLHHSRGRPWGRGYERGGVGGGVVDFFCSFSFIACCYVCCCLFGAPSSASGEGGA